MSDRFFKLAVIAMACATLTGCFFAAASIDRARFNNCAAPAAAESVS